jgi:long-chain fatty acid transport protein
VAVQGGLGVDLGYGVRVGGGFAALAALTGAVDVATDASGRIGTTVEDTLVASYAPIVGASYEFDAFETAWRLGLAFRGELVGRFNVVITAQDLGALNVPPLNISGVAQYDPWQIAAEVGHVVGAWRFALNVTYKHWPAYPGPIEATVRCEDAPPDATCTAPQPADPGYSPVAAPHLGIEWQAEPDEGVRTALRTGYAFEPSPAPEQPGRTSWLDNHRHVVSLGFGVRLFDPVPLPLDVDGFVQVQALQPRSHQKDTAQGAIASGTVETRGVVLAAGTAVGVRF